MQSYVLVAQNHPETNALLEVTVAKLGLHCHIATDAATAIIAAGEEALGRVALVVLDLHLPDGDGISVLKQLREKVNVPIIVLAGAEAVGSAEVAFEAGASDFIIKPITAERITIAVRNALRVRALEGEIARITRKVDGRLSFSDVICNALEMQRAVMLGRRAADLEMPVLLEGEIGTGKEMFAKAIHGDSDRSGHSFVMIHCADPASAAAWSNRQSYLADAWTEARNGVLFLDEIGELPLSLQDELVTLLEPSDSAKSDDATSGYPRLICTTSQNLIERVKTKQFREDLYYRINVFPIWLPSLRERQDDIDELASNFTARFSADVGKYVEGIDEQAKALLHGYAWPGNVRQLENMVYRAVVLAEGDKLMVQDFPQIAAGLRPQNGAPSSAPYSEAKAPYNGPAMLGGNWPGADAITLPSSNGAALGIPILTQDGEIRSLTEIEADLIRMALGHYRGHITEGARRLGIGRSTLYRKMREFG
ncbi:MAG: sigma-54 dependent transcriptional regulator, partial [Alphaproteobacteria bacterium]